MCTSRINKLGTRLFRMIHTAKLIRTLWCIQSLMPLKAHKNHIELPAWTTPQKHIFHYFDGGWLKLTNPYSVAAVLQHLQQNDFVFLPNPNRCVSTRKTRPCPLTSVEEAEAAGWCSRTETADAMNQQSGWVDSQNSKECRDIWPRYRYRLTYTFLTICMTLHGIEYHMFTKLPVQLCTNLLNTNNSALQFQRAHPSCMHVGDGNLYIPDCYGWAVEATTHMKIYDIHIATPLNPLKDTILPWIVHQIRLKLAVWKLHQFFGLIRQQANTMFHSSMVPIEYPSRDQWPVRPIDDKKGPFYLCCAVAVSTKTQLSNFLGTPGEDYFKGNPKSLNFYFLVIWWGKEVMVHDSWFPVVTPLWQHFFVKS